jgi:hypothetical protein
MIPVFAIKIPVQDTLLTNSRQDRGIFASNWASYLPPSEDAPKRVVTQMRSLSLKDADTENSRRQISPCLR